jgi:flagellar basal-body rod protein FlgB
MIMLEGNSTKNIDLMQRAMSASVLRNEVLNDNIANATTPNYKRKDVTFQAELMRAINTEKQREEFQLKTSRENHIPAYRVKDYKDVSAKIVTEYNTYQNNNGNSVDIEKEMLESSKNSMYYNALAQRTASTFNKLKFILRSN